MEIVAEALDYISLHSSLSKEVGFWVNLQLVFSTQVFGIHYNRCSLDVKLLSIH